MNLVCVHTILDIVSSSSSIFFLFWWGEDLSEVELGTQKSLVCTALVIRVVIFIIVTELFHSWGGDCSYELLRLAKLVHALKVRRVLGLLELGRHLISSIQKGQTVVVYTLGWNDCSVVSTFSESPSIISSELIFIHSVKFIYLFKSLSILINYFKNKFVKLYLINHSFNMFNILDRLSGETMRIADFPFSFSRIQQRGYASELVALLYKIYKEEQDSLIGDAS